MILCFCFLATTTNSLSVSKLFIPNPAFLQANGEAFVKNLTTLRQVPDSSVLAERSASEFLSKVPISAVYTSRSSRKLMSFSDRVSVSFWVKIGSDPMCKFALPFFELFLPNNRLAVKVTLGDGAGASAADSSGSDPSSGFQNAKNVSLPTTRDDWHFFKFELILSESQQSMRIDLNDASQVTRSFPEVPFDKRNFEDVILTLGSTHFLYARVLWYRRNPQPRESVRPDGPRPGGRNAHVQSSASSDGIFPGLLLLAADNEGPEFRAEPGLPDEYCDRIANQPADLMLKASSVPFFTNYMDYPTVHAKGSPWECTGSPVPIGHVPFLVRSFVMTFDYFKRSGRPNSSVSGARLNPFRIAFQTPSDSFSVEVYFTLSLTV